MFDIGSTELMLVAIVALLVLGPERLPEALRTVGLWWGRMRRTFNSVRSEIAREVGMDEVRRQIYNESIMSDLEQARREIRQAADDTRSVVQEASNAVDEPNPTQTTRSDAADETTSPDPALKSS